MIIITPEETTNQGTCKLGSKSVFLAKFQKIGNWGF